MIVVIDSGIANIGSVVAACRRVGVVVEVGGDANSVLAASALILPGVGSFADGMDSLRRRDLIRPIRDAAGVGIPILGICLGMQMLACSGEEFGAHAGLGLIRGGVKALSPVAGSRVPNMGWCPVHPAGASSSLLDGLKPGEAFYFAHSFHLICDDERDVMATTPWGEGRIVAAVRRGHVSGVQFHPEKSQDAGLQLLHAFLSSRRSKSEV